MNGITTTVFVQEYINGLNYLLKESMIQTDTSVITVYMFN